MNYTNAADNDQGQFQGGNPNIGLKGTVVDAAWLNAVQSEIVTPIVSNNINLDKTDNEQLKKSIDKYIYDKKFNRVLFSDIKNSITRYSFETIFCPPKSFVDFDIYINALCGSGGSATVLIRAYDDPSGAGGDSISISFEPGERKREMHRLVYVNNSGSNRSFKITCNTITPGAVLDFELVTVAGCIDFSNSYKG